MKNDACQKTEQDKLVTKINAFDTKIPSTSGLVTKIQYDSGKQGLEKKIGDILNLTLLI